MKYTVYYSTFDYTLADSSRGIVTCFRSVLERHGYTGITDDMIKRTIGKTLEESFSILTGITDADQLESFRQEYSKEADIYMNANTILFPDTLPTLTHLKKQGIRIGIISTKYRFRILSFLRNHMPDDWFDIIIGGEDVTHHKPDPEGLLLAIDRLKACPEEVLYIGDSTVDAGTAAAAGVSFTGVTSGMTTAQEFQAYPYDRIISTLGQLISVPEANPAVHSEQSNRMTSVHRITVQKKVNICFHNRVLFRFRHPERRKKPNGDFRGRKDGLPGSESLTFRKKKQAFGRKDVSIHRKCPYVLEISPIVFPNISYCYSKSGLKGTLRLPVGNRRQSFLK